jgi:hypothetical protein
MVLADFRLSRGQRRAALALTRVVCPGDVAALGIADDVVDEFELMLRAFPGHARFGLVATLLLIEWLAVLAPSSLGRPFSRLPRARQERWFHRWIESPLFVARQLAKVLRGVIAMGYYEHPSVKRRIGFQPERWIERVKQEREERFGDEIRRGEEAVTAADPLVPASALARRGREGA